MAKLIRFQKSFMSYLLELFLMDITSSIKTRLEVTTVWQIFDWLHEEKQDFTMVTGTER